MWIALAVPQLLTQHGSGGDSVSAIRWQVGWLAASNDEPWLWFWAKNLGWLAPLFVFALLDRTLLAPPARRLILATLPLFVACNLVVFVPWEWDNTKFLFYWYLALCVAVAALLTRVWRAHRSAVVRATLAAMVATTVLSGVLIHAAQLTGKDRHRMFSTEELTVAEQLRARTPAQAIFATDFRHNNPVSALTGRRTVAGYGGWLFSHGIDYAQRHQDVRAVYALGPDFEVLVARYGIDYLLIGPGEVSEFAPDLEAFRARFPAVVITRSHTVFAVGADLSARSPATSAGTGPRR